MAVTTFKAQADNMRAAREAARNLATVLHAGGLGAERSLHDVGVEVTNEVRRLLSKPGTGRLYRVRLTPSRGNRHGGPTRHHRASSPGRPPAVNTGRLRASYTWRVGRDATLGGAPYVDVGTNVAYAKYLEFGTRRMAARPHLRPAISNVTPRIVRLIAGRYEKAQREAAVRLRGAGRLGRLP